MLDTPEALPMPLVRELLDMPEIMAGEPEIIANTEALEAPVRWGHVVAGTSASALLDGGEFVLTTGAGWPNPAAPPPEHHSRADASAALTALLHELCNAGISALVFELGTRFTEAPRELHEVMVSRGVALIILHREVKFVQITQRIHRLILGAQNDALQAKQQVHTLFTELGLNRSPVDYMVEQMAAIMGAPIVLENTAGQVIAWSSPDTSVGAADVLSHWAAGRFVPASTKLNAHDSTNDTEPLIRVAVEARGTRWGTLTALPGPHHPAGRSTVLELGAIALALGRLADDSEEWLQLSSKQLFDVLLSGRFRTETDVHAQLTAAGLPFEGCTLSAISLTSVGNFGSHSSLEHAVLETALRRALAPEGRSLIADAPHDFGVTAPHARSPHPQVQVAEDVTARPTVSLLALISLPLHDKRLESGMIEGGSADPPLAVRLNRELEMLVPATTPPSWRAHLSLGTATGDARQPANVRGLLTSLEGVIAAGQLEPSATAGRVTVQEARRQPLTYLLREMAGSPALQRYVDEVLGPLVEHDRSGGPGHTGDLVRVLASVAKHPGNRSLAATEARLSRSVLYQRIELIEDLLGVDLTDGETLATLAVALTAHAIHS